jgi:Recombination endonuclease VII
MKELTKEQRGRDKYLRKQYGISLDEFFQIWKEQGGLCAICGKRLEDVRVEVDHLHGRPDLPRRETVRGLLCGGRYAGCNRKLGNRNVPDWLHSAGDYLADPPAKHVLKFDPTAIPRNKEKKKRRKKRA